MTRHIRSTLPLAAALTLGEPALVTVHGGDLR